MQSFGDILLHGMKDGKIFILAPAAAVEQRTFAVFVAAAAFAKIHYFSDTRHGCLMLCPTAFADVVHFEYCDSVGKDVTVGTIVAR